MATTITIQPVTNILVSTLLPVYYQISDTSLDTTNIIAKCFVQDQVTLIQTQIGGSYRLAPHLEFSGTYRFDASEIFNTVTKGNLNFIKNTIGTTSGFQNAITNWADESTYFVNVEFFREYLDAATGLIVVDPTATISNKIYIIEGCPDKPFLLQAVKDNGSNAGAFKFFTALYNAEDTYRRYFTNYPIALDGGVRVSNVTIHESEQYMLTFQTPRSSRSNLCPYFFETKTYDDAGTLLNTHSSSVAESLNVQSIMVGFFDIVNNLTANLSEGSDFRLVTNYTVDLRYNKSTVVCSYASALTVYNFKVNRDCIKRSGYLRFAFKNMLGGYDMVTSNGKFAKKVKNKFDDFEKSLGYFGWNETMDFGSSNWANQNVERFTVTTQMMTKKTAAHFAEMFSSTQVYLKHEQIAQSRVANADLSVEALDQPNVFYPIVLKSANINIDQSNENHVSLKFQFEMAVNQRNPRA